MKTIYRLFNVQGNCLNCNWELGEVSYLVDPPVEPYLFAAQNGALCAECALTMAADRALGKEVVDARIVTP